MSVEPVTEGAEDSPDGLARRIVRVNNAASRSDWRRVIKVGRSVLRADPVAGVALFAPIARALMELPPDPATLAWFDSLAEAHAPPRTFSQLGWLHHWAGDPERAKIWLRRGWLAKTPDVKSYETLLDLLPAYVDAFDADLQGLDPPRQKMLVHMLLAIGDVTEARRRLDHLIGHDPEADIHALLATLDNEAGDTDGAEAHLRAAIDLIPDDPEPGRRLQVLGEARRLGLTCRPAIRPPVEEPLVAKVAPHRPELRASLFLKRYFQNDLRDALRVEVFRPGAAALGWVHPVYCSSATGLSPRARQVSKRGFLLDLVPPVILDAIRAGDGTLLIDHANEGLFRNAKREPQAFLEMLQYLHETGIAPERVIILDANAKSPETAARLAEQAGLVSPPILAEDLPWLSGFSAIFRQMRRGAGGIDERLIESAKTVHDGCMREKHFLCFNHAPRPHRAAVVAFLLERGLIDRGFVSFKGASYWREKKGAAMDDKAWIELLSSQIVTLADFNDPVDLVRRLAALCPLEVDVPFEGTGTKAKILGFGANNAWPYLNSYLSVVTETDFSNGRIHTVTEKPIKPMANLHPFIYVGEQGVLARLRQRGYRTFSTWIDESYDEIQQPRVRMMAVLAEVNRLLSMPIEKLHALYCDAWPTLLHNYRTLMDEEPLIAEQMLMQIRRLAA